MVMPQCSSGPPNDFFLKDCPFTLDKFIQDCLATFNYTGYTPGLMRPDFVIHNYGSRFPTATNIVFSNGYLDPWSGGGWRSYPTTKGTLVSLIVEDGAHHYDLRGAHPNDTASVKEVRSLEKLHISRWIREAKKRTNKRHHKISKKTLHTVPF
jgi:lysosomal Pro-X carboxypeptidase